MEKGATIAPELKESVNVISYTCVQCQSKFNNIQNLRAHVWTEHEKHLLEVKKHTQSIRPGIPEESAKADEVRLEKMFLNNFEPIKKFNVKIQVNVDEEAAPMEIPDLSSAISTLQELISEDNSVAETGGNVVTKRILDLLETQEEDDQHHVSEEKTVRFQSNLMT